MVLHGTILLYLRIHRYFGDSGIPSNSYDPPPPRPPRSLPHMHLAKHPSPPPPNPPHLDFSKAIPPGCCLIIMEII